MNSASGLEYFCVQWELNLNIKNVLLVICWSVEPFHLLNKLEAVDVVWVVDMCTTRIADRQLRDKLDECSHILMNQQDFCMFISNQNMFLISC